MRFLAGLFAIIAVLTAYVVCPSTHAYGQEQDQSNEIAAANTLLAEFNAAWTEDEFETLVERGESLQALPLWPHQSRELQGSTALRLGYGYYRLENFEASLEQYAAVERLGWGLRIVHFWRSILHNSQENWLAAQADIVSLASLDAELLSQAEMPYYSQILDGLEQDEHDLEAREMLAALITNYQPEPVYRSMDGWRYRYARLLAETGETLEAIRQIQPILSGSLRVSIRTEAAFEPLWSRSTFDTLTDVRSGEEAALARHRRHQQMFPDHLDPITGEVRSLLVLGRFEEAERVARHAASRLAAGEFTDSDDQGNWLHNEWAYSLYALGRVDDGNDIMAAGAALNERGDPNVSQTINMAAMYNAQGRHLAALETLENVSAEHTSAYGMMWVWAERACALRSLGRDIQSRESFGFVAENWEDNAAAAMKARLCANDFEGAVELMVMRLATPGFEQAALEALQGAQPLFDAAALPVRARHLVLFQQVRQDERVIEAAQTVGRIEDHDIVSAYWGGF